MLTIIPSVAIALWILIEAPMSVRRAIAKPPPFILSTLLAIAVGLTVPGSVAFSSAGFFTELAVYPVLKINRWLVRASERNLSLPFRKSQE